MKTLILKTEGMSAYGLQTFDVHRRVNHFLTRSAVMGLLGSCMGITRERYEDLFSLSQQVKLAVQVNKVGEKIVDYHTVQGFRSPLGKIQKGTKPTYREYYCDAEYSFALSAEDAVIQQLESAVKSPVFTPFQGRKTCPLMRPLFEKTVFEGNPANALCQMDSEGQIFSDMQGENHFATLQVRDLLTVQPRKYAIRTVYVSGKQGGNDESA